MYILLTLSESCNLKCIGCSASETTTNKTLKMENICDVIATLSTLDNEERISTIVLHGCETFMCSPEPLDKILNWISTNLPHAKLSCQTNATLIISRKEIYEILKKYNVYISTSYRGTKELFEKVTGVPNSYDLFEEGVNELKKYIKNVGAIIYVPTNLEDEFNEHYEEIIDDVVRLGIKSLKINEFESDVPNKRYFEFVTKCMDYVMKKAYDLEIHPVFMLLKTLHGCGMMECSWTHTCKNFVSVKIDGSTQNCNRNYKQYRPIYKECMLCPIYGWCKGGCEAIRDNFNDKKFPYCEDRIKLLDWILKNRKKLYSYYLIYKCKKIN